MNKKIYTILLLSLLSFSTAKAEDSYQTHKEILAAVQQYLDTHLTVTQDIEIKTQIGHLDTRLKLSSCNQPLKSFSTNHASFGSKISVGVKCEGLKPWSLYVPVNIQRVARVFVAARPIAKGNEISSADIQQVSKDITKLRGNYSKSKSEIIGKVSKRSIALGSVFNPRYLRLPIVIKKGDSVDIIAETNGLKIRMSGKAIDNGAKGQKISVRNLSSKRIIQAIVQHPGLVKIML